MIGDAFLLHLVYGDAQDFAQALMVENVEETPVRLGGCPGLAAVHGGGKWDGDVEISFDMEGEVGGFENPVELMHQMRSLPDAGADVGSLT